MLEVLIGIVGAGGIIVSVHDKLCAVLGLIGRNAMSAQWTERVCAISIPFGTAVRLCSEVRAAGAGDS